MSIVGSPSVFAPTPASAGGRTAFERNLLAQFATWFLDRLDEVRPDLLLPAETKGVRVLETVLAYAQQQLGRRVEVPVLYATALPFADRETLRRSRVMVVDDAVRTGSSLRRHMKLIERHGASDLHAFACIGYGGEEDGEEPPARCFRIVEDMTLYRRYAWQLTELVTARGLPPEIDHHVFTLRLPVRLQRALEILQRRLSVCGDLTIDAFDSGDAQIAGMTLHYPTLGETTATPDSGEVHNEGVNKIRLFPDLSENAIHVVPVCFPEMELADVDDGPLPIDRARQLLRDWAGRGRPLGELLLSEAVVHEPEMVFRALSSCTEMSLMHSFAQVVGEAFPTSQVTLKSERPLLRRLYGDHAGERIATHVDDELASVLRESSSHMQRGSELDDRTDQPPEKEPLWLDAPVVEQTIAIARTLKDLYDERAKAPDHDPTERVGLSLSEIESRMNLSRLLVSRCFDYGLAMTTLVPYVQVERSEGRLRARRAYRVSEVNTDTERCMNIEDVHREASEETLALIAHYLQLSVSRFADSAIPIEVISWIVGILRPIVLAEHDIRLHAEPEPGFDAPGVYLTDTRAFPLTQVQSSMFTAEDGVRPTARFEKAYDAKKLDLDLRRSCAAIEEPLRLIAEMIERMPDETKLSDVLAEWAMSSDLRLGLTHVRADLDAALTHLQGALSIALREEPHDAYDCDLAHVERMAKAAVRKLDRLADAQAHSAIASEQRGFRTQRLLVESVRTLATPPAMYELCRSL